MIKIKNKTYSPIPLVIDGSTLLVPARETVEVSEITPQITALKARGLLQIIKK